MGILASCKVGVLEVNFCFLIILCIVNWFFQKLLSRVAFIQLNVDEVDK